MENTIQDGSTEFRSLNVIDELTKLSARIDELTKLSARIAELEGQLKSNSGNVLNFDLRPYVGREVSAINEYIRYSKYGRLVILDVGGVVFKSSGSSKILINPGVLPVQRTRVVNFGFYDMPGSNPSFCVYGTQNGTQINIHVPNTNRFYGMYIYLTD